jgi:DNA-binding HxlR family transcriptional regulator
MRDALHAKISSSRVSESMFQFVQPVLSILMKSLASYEHKIDRLRDDCPVKATLDVIRGRWKPSIICEIRDKAKRFTELQDALPGLTAQTLSLQLKQLETDEIVLRTVYPEVPARVEYQLTEYGRTLAPIFDQLEVWGKTYQERSRAKR